MGRVIGSGDTEFVYRNTTDIGDIVNNGGTLDVYGEAVATTVNAGGLEMVSNVGVAFGTQLNAGAVQIDYGTAYGTNLTGVSGDIAEQFVEAHAAAHGTVVNQFAFQEIDNDGFAYNATINSHGWQDIKAGGYAEETIIDGGAQYVENNGWSMFTHMFGGTEIVENGGTSEDTQVNGASMSNRGDLVVLAGGWSQDASIDLYGVEDVYGIDHDSFVVGEQVVHSGGETGKTILEQHGVEQVQAGGLADDTTIGTNASMTVMGGGTADNVIFAGTNSLLDVGAGASVIGSIYGFGASDQINLRNLQFGPGTTMCFIENNANTGGELTVCNGWSADEFYLQGQYTTANFGLSAGQGGSVLVTGH